MVMKKNIYIQSSDFIKLLDKTKSYLSDHQTEYYDAIYLLKATDSESFDSIVIDYMDGTKEGISSDEEMAKMQQEMLEELKDNTAYIANEPNSSVVTRSVKMMQVSLSLKEYDASLVSDLPTLIGRVQDEITKVKHKNIFDFVISSSMDDQGVFRPCANIYYE